MLEQSAVIKSKVQCLRKSRFRTFDEFLNQPQSSAQSLISPQLTRLCQISHSYRKQSLTTAESPVTFTHRSCGSQLGNYMPCMGSCAGWSRGHTQIKTPDKSLVNMRDPCDRLLPGPESPDRPEDNERPHPPHQPSLPSGFECRPSKFGCCDLLPRPLADRLTKLKT